MALTTLIMLAAGGFAGCITYDPGYEVVTASQTGNEVELVTLNVEVDAEPLRFPVELTEGNVPVRLDLAVTAERAAGLRVYGLGSCEWQAPDLFDGQDAASLDCGALPAGSYELVIEQRAGHSFVAASVVAIAE